MPTLAEIKLELAALQAKYFEVAAATFKESSDKLFAQFPELKSFGWRQYTPYFNDGDSCEFSAHTDDVAINGFDPYDREKANDDGAINLLYRGREKLWGKTGEYPNPDYDPRAKEVVEAVKSFMAQFTEDYLREAFGDHKNVTVSAAGVVAEHLEHD